MQPQTKTIPQTTQQLIEQWLQVNVVTVCPPAIAQGADVNPLTRQTIAWVLK